MRTFARVSSISIPSIASTPVATQGRPRTGLELLLGGHLRQVGEGGVELGLVIRTVFELAGLEIDIGLHVEMTMAA